MAAIQTAILTVSDRGSAGQRDDRSGDLLAQLLTQNGCKIIWRAIVPDDRDKIADALRSACDGARAALVLTTGGTGLSPRDVTPEATRDVGERDVPGIPEAIRAASLRYTNRAMLSRGVAVTRGRSLIINLPGSPKAVQECLDVVMPVLAHAHEVLCGGTQDCARPE